jgi:hypothetical protein
VAAGLQTRLAGRATWLAIGRTLPSIETEAFERFLLPQAPRRSVPDEPTIDEDTHRRVTSSPVADYGKVDEKLAHNMIHARIDPAELSENRGRGLVDQVAKASEPFNHV